MEEEEEVSEENHISAHKSRTPSRPSSQPKIGVTRGTPSVTTLVVVSRGGRDSGRSKVSMSLIWC